VTTAIAPTLRRAGEIDESVGPLGTLAQFRNILDGAVSSDASFLAAADPTTLLASSAVLIGTLPDWTCAPYWDNEFLVDDFIKYADLHRGRVGPTTLGRATSGRLARSSRFAEIYSQVGLEHELRATLASGNACWGFVSLIREAGRPDFTDEELSLIGGLAAIMGAKLRRATLAARRGQPDDTSGPGVAVFDASGHLERMTERATELLSLFDVRDSVAVGAATIPSEAYIVCVRARARAFGRIGPDPVVRTIASGRRITMRAETVIGSEGTGDATVLMIEPSRPSDVVPIIVAAHELTRREEEVLAMLLSGRTARDIAARLYISEHTARDHTKSIYEKVGVGSRNELVAQLFDTHYLPTMEFNHSGG
jgi:DNA-binding CsgD family transcriptional regulator